MSDPYATPTELAARLSTAYPVPDDAEMLLVKASELIDYATLGRSQDLIDREAEFADHDRWEVRRALLADATCDQVEYWLEVGEEHDVVGLAPGSSLQGGRVQVQKMPGALGQRARRTLLRAGLLYYGTGVK